MSDDRRKIELSVEIDADRETVWAAISDPEQLARWFPLAAAVEPGEGGSITLSWGPGCEATAPLTVWEPGRRLGWAEEYPGADGEPVRVAVDLRIEGEGGTTTLRLVQAGFSDDDRWDEYLATLDSGWRYFLYNLKHYLERHGGQPRRMVWDRRQVEGDKEAVWRRVIGIYGLDGSAPIEAGGDARLWDGTPAEVVRARPPLHLVLRIRDLDEALLLVELEPGSGRFSLGTWLSLYGDAGRHADRLEESLSASYSGLPGATDPGDR